jgi:tyrosyl-tRNA synthetase
MDEVRRLGALKDKEINIAKKVLAFEVTKLIHGQEEAEKAQQAAEALFSGAGILDNAPTVSVANAVIGTKLLDVLVSTGIIPSKSEGRRLMQQGGLYIGDTKVSDLDFVLSADLFVNNSLIIRKGKKNYHRIIIE